MNKVLLATSIVACLTYGYEIGVGVGYDKITKSNLLDKKTNFNIRIGKELPKNHILRLELERSNGSGIDLSRTLLNIEHYFTHNQLQPYAFLGAGYQKSKDEYKSSMLADLGIGAKYHINPKWDIFGEIRALRDFANNDNHFGAMVGLDYKFGDAKDSDNDGVLDSVDQCPNTPAGVEVDENGCALISQAQDKDSDNDGVLDSVDQCPKTPSGVKVDNNGCALPINLDVHFATNSAKLTPQAQAKVAKFADFLKQHTDIKVVIEGYTDNRGSKDYNIKLSQRRAQSVYDELIKDGICMNRLSYKGYGPANPIAPNDTKEGRAANRRVVAKIVE
ncbi:MAG: OmpA family protein [Epsilonproteobacteria bacterium]|nr:OmpA family protein [Campylobacterota bacterium]